MEAITIKPKESKLRVEPEWADVCFTCGTCASGCPVTGVDGLDPRKAIRMAALGIGPTAGGVGGGTQAGAPEGFGTAQLRRDMPGIEFFQDLASQSPQLAEAISPEQQTRLQQNILGLQVSEREAKNMLRGLGLTTRLRGGGSYDPTQLDPSKFDPRYRAGIEAVRRIATSRRALDEAAYGPRAGYATRGAGFGTGAYQPKAMTGGTGATRSQLLKGRAPATVPGEAPKGTVPGT